MICSTRCRRQHECPSAKIRAHHSFGAPRLDEFQLLRKTRGIARGGESLLAQNRRDLVLPVPIGRRTAEAQHDDVRPVAPDHPDDIAQGAVVSPFFHGFGRGLGESEVDGAGEKLVRPVDLASRQQLLRTDDAQQRPLFRADEVLPAFAAGERKIRRAHVPPAREIGQDGASARHRGARRSSAPCPTGSAFRGIGGFRWRPETERFLLRRERRQRQ